MLCSLPKLCLPQLVTEVVPELEVLQTPWPRLTYKEALERYGTDKPDIRFGMELMDITDLAESSGFKVFQSVAASGGHIRGLKAEGLGDYSRKQFDELTDFVKRFKAKGLAYMAYTSDGQVRSSFAKFLSEETLQGITDRFEPEPGDLLLFVADKPAVVFDCLGRLRELLGDRLGLRDPNILGFCWVIDFPFVMWNEDEATLGPKPPPFHIPNGGRYSSFGHKPR